MNTVLVKTQAGSSVNRGVFLPVSIDSLWSSPVFLFSHWITPGLMHPWQTSSALRLQTAALCVLLVHSYVTNAHRPHGFCFCIRTACLCVMCLLLWEGQEACGVPSPLQLKPVSPPGELGPCLQDSWGSPDSPAHLVWSKACRFAARCLDRICSLPATLHPQALHLIRITCHVSYITWSCWCQLSAKEMR